MSGDRKTVVISDVHLSNGADYTWSPPPYPDHVAAMLEQVATDPDAAELLILGDLLDLWMYPVDVQPFTPGAIIADSGNAKAMEALKDCVAALPAVYYITGNHDMSVTAADIAPLHKGGKALQWITPEDYRSGHHPQWWCEHGHCVDVFNAPDISGDALAGLPLGFYITRLMASSTDHEDFRQYLAEQLRGLLGDLETLQALSATDAKVKLSPLPKFLWEALAAYAGVPPDTPIRMAAPGLDGKYTIGDVGNHYNGLFRKWWERCGGLKEFYDATMVAVADDGLNWYADTLLARPDPPALVFFGHTHHALTQGSYSNDGCWCAKSRDKDPHYLTIEGNTATLRPWPPPPAP